MDILGRRNALLTCFFCVSLLPTFHGCTHDSKDDVIDELRPVVHRFSTLEEATQFASQWPSMELFPREPSADDDVGGVTFQPGSKLTAKQARALGKLENLTFIAAEYCSFEPGFFKSLAKSDVSLLLLGNSDLDDSSTAAIASLPNIKAVFVQNTNVTKRGLQELRKSIGTENVITHPI